METQHPTGLAIGNEPPPPNFHPHTCRNCKTEFFSPWADAVLCEPCNETVAFGTALVARDCESCGESFQAAGMRMGSVIKVFGKFCQACSDAKEAKEKEDKRQAFIASREADWFATCPEFYRTDGLRDALKNQAITCPPEFRKKGQGEGATIAKATLTREAAKAGRGIMLYGPSGNFKTSAMLHGAVKYLVWEGVPVKFVFAADFKNDASHAARETTIPAFIKPMVEAPWLFLDDLGNMAGTPGAEDGLHALIEARMRAKRPMLVTTQFTGPALIGRFTFRERGESIIRRILTMTGAPIHFP